MAFDISALAAYTKDNQDSLILSSLFDAKTQQLIQSEGTVMSEVKSAEQINVLETDAVFQAGGGCGFNSSGTTAFTRRTLTIGKIKVNESLCPKTLQSTYLQLKMKAGSRPEAIIFEKEYTSRKAGKIAEQLETAIWQGDLNSGNANLNKFDGFIKIIDASNLAIASNAIAGAGTITSTTGSTTLNGVSTKFSSSLNNNLTGATGPLIGAKVYGVNSQLIGTVASVTSDTVLVLVANGAVALAGVAFTVVPTTAKSFAAPVLATTGLIESNIRTTIKQLWQQIPARVKGKKDVRVFCGWDVFEIYIGALIEANLYAYTAKNDAQATGELTIPGTQYVLTAVHGLDATNRMYALRTSNMYLGCDILGEEDKWEIFYAKEADEVRFVSEWKMGTQVAFPFEIVQFTLA